MPLQKKILHFHPNGKFALSFVKPLIDSERAEGYNSSLITSTNSIFVGAKQIPYDLNLKNLFFLPYACFRIYSIFRRELPNIVISHNTKSSTLVLACAWLAKVPVRIYFNHGVPYIGHHGLTKIALFLLEKLNLSLSTKVLTVSIDMLVLLRRINSFKSISLINFGSACGLDLSVYSVDKHSQSTFRRDHNISGDDLVVLFIGRPELRKGFNLSLHLWIKHFSSTNFKLVMCGPTELNVVKALGYLPNNIVCLGFTDKLPEILSQSNVLILPSQHEGLSYAILEAFASKCIVIANKIPGITSLVENEFNGFLIENNEIGKYAEIISKIHTLSESNRDVLQNNALQTVKKFSRESFLPEYLLYLQ
jgi:glycosyltransferase involved in cell wall biosynthesis